MNSKRSEGRRRRQDRRRSRLTLGQTLGGRFEQLEDRRLLAVGVIGTQVLDSVESAINTAGDVSAATLTLAGGGDLSVVGLRAHGNGTFDPTAPRIEDAEGAQITPIWTQADGTGGRDGLLLAELPAGEYRVLVGGENATTGQFVIEAFLLGDIDADGRVADPELATALAAAVSQMGFGNSWVTARAFASAGLDSAGDHYHAEQDANFNGTIDRFDLVQIEQNHGDTTLQVTLVADDTPPLVDAQLRNDTGRSDLPDTLTDGITGDVSGDVIVGSISDASSIASLRGGVDQADPLGFFDVTLGNDGISFALTLADLQQLANGGALEDNGAHTLYLVAEDLHGNATAPPFELVFAFDTIAPAVPTDLDLVASSDSGDLNDDDLTRDATPTMTVTAEAERLVELLAGGVVVGQAVATGTTTSLTADPLADGTRTMTATATDLAGNQSGPSAALDIIIDSTGPAIDTFDLSAGSDSGLAGDRMTNVPVVDLVGETEPGIAVELSPTGTTTQGDAQGSFGFLDVTLPFGATDLTVTATDSAGNTTTRTETFVHNSDPKVDQPVDPVTVDEDADPEAGIDLAGLFGDDDLGDGDGLTLDVAGNTNPSLVTATLNDATAGNSIDNDALTLAFSGNANGVAEVTIRATDSFGQTATSTIQITVNPVNDLPDAPSGAVTTNEDEAVDLDLWTLVEDTETPDDQLAFAVGGAFGGTVELLADGHTAHFVPDAHFNDNLGTAGFTYTVTDSGEAGGDEATVADVPVDVGITPVNDAPVAVDDQYTVSPTELFTNLDALQNDTDADLAEGDTLTIVDFDATTVEGGLVVRADNGTFTYDPNGVFDTIEPNVQPTDSFSYTISDSAGSESSATVDLTIFITTPPDATDDLAETNEETLIDIDVLADNGNGPDTDPDGDDALLTVIQVDTASAHGANLEITAAGQVRYDPTAAADLNALADGEATSDTFTYTVQDQDGGTAQATVTVTVNGRNDPPTAVADQASTDSTTAIPIDVLDNDIDHDSSDTLTVDSVDTTSAQGATITLQGDGTVSYDPNGVAAFEALAPGEPTTDTFEYTIRDPHGALDFATVTVTVTGHNDAPNAEPDSADTDEDTQQTITVLANDDDPNPGDTLTIDSADLTSVQGAVITVQPDGTIVYNPTEADALQALAEAGSLDDTFQYTIRDSVGELSTATVTVTVTGRNDAPTAMVDAASTNGDEAVDIDVVDNDEDPDAGETLVVETFDAVSDKGATISLNPDGTLHYDPTTSTSIGALAAGGILADSFNYAVSDGHGGTTSSTSVAILVKGVNDDPTAVDDDDFVVTGNSLNNILEVLANDTIAPDVGETLTIVDVGTPSANATVLVTDQGTRLNYTPATGFEGTETFTYTVEDGNGGTAQATVTVTVEPPAAPDLVVIALDTTDLLGNPLDVQEVDGVPLPTVTVGESFFLNVYVQDVRSAPTGVFAGYVDLEYDPTVVTYLGPDATGLIPGADYLNSRSGDTSVFGLIDELGGADGLGFPAGTEGASRLLVSVRLAATESATTTFTTSPADITPSHFVLLFDGLGGVPNDQLDFGTTSLRVVPAAGVAATAADDAVAGGGTTIVALLAPSLPVPLVADPLADPAAVAAATGPEAGDVIEPSAVTGLVGPTGTLADGAAEPPATEPLDGALDAALADIAAEITQAWSDGSVVV